MHWLFTNKHKNLTIRAEETLSHENTTQKNIYSSELTATTLFFKRKGWFFPHYQNVLAYRVSIPNMRKSENLLELLLGIVLYCAFQPLGGRLYRETVGLWQEQTWVQT